RFQWLKRYRQALGAVVSLLVAFPASAQLTNGPLGSLEDVTDPLAAIWLVRADDMVIAHPRTTTAQTPQGATIVTAWTPRFWAFLTDDKQIQSQTPAKNIVGALSCGWKSPSTNPAPQQTRVGRFFNLDHDVVVTLTVTNNVNGQDGCTGEQNMAFYVEDLKANPDNPTRLSTTRTTISPPDWIQSAVGDFDFDGYDDFLVISSQGAFIATASDVDNPGAGFILTQPVNIAFNRTPFSEPAVGDFNADGDLDVAWTGGLLVPPAEVSLFFATICSGESSSAICDGQSAFTFVQDPGNARPITLTDVFVGGICPPLPSQQFLEFTPSASAVAAGNFLTTAGEELVVAATITTIGSLQNCKSQAYLYDFDANLTPTRRSTIATLGRSNQYIASAMYAAPAQFDWFGLGDLEQVVIAQGGGALGLVSPQQDVIVITFDQSNQQMTQHVRNFTTLGFVTQNLQGLAVGRFSTAPTESSVNPSVFSPQFAILRREITETSNSGQVIVLEVDVEGNDFQPEVVQNFDIGRAINTANVPNRGGSYLRVGDLRGRGYKLGVPLYTQVDTAYQLDVDVGQPPMHAAWLPMQGLAPSDLSPLNQFSACNQADRTVTDSTFCLVNFSVVPDGFNSRFRTSVVETNQSQTSDSLSYGWSLQTAVAGKTGTASFGPIDNPTGTLQLELRSSAATTYQDNFEEKYAVSATNGFNVSTQTSFSDVLWYTRRSQRFYFYPVIGIDACPEEDPDCDQAEREQLIYMLEGPTTVETGRGDGRTAEFFNPVHQPNNIFTYPWSCEVLAARYDVDICRTSANPNPTDLLQSTGLFRTDTSSSSFSADWNTETGESETSGTSQNYSWSIGETLTIGTPKLFAGAEFKQALEYSSSEGISSSMTNTTVLGESTGVAGVKSAEFLNPGLFEYPVNGYIFGNPLPASTVFDLPVETENVATGVLRFKFTADPTDFTQAGSWWSTGPYARNFDLGLNRPYRFSEAPGRLTVGDGTKITQCRSKDLAEDRAQCIRSNRPFDGDLWNSQFYWLRGFFITNGTQATGPQLGSAEAGELLTLSARIYNMSLYDMDRAGVDRVLVRFYGQRLNDFKEPEGDSFFIGESALSPIPGFNSPRVPNRENWSLASVNFDTTGFDATDLLFWIVTYAVDSAGNMVEEITGYGLGQQPPADPTSVTSIYQVSLQEVTLFDADGIQTDDSFTNNVGYHHFAFQITPATSEGASADDELLEGELMFDGFSPSVEQVRLGETVILSADIRSLGRRSIGTEVLFFDGNPDEGGADLIDWEQTAFIEAEGMRRSQVPYTPNDCGRREIHVIADNGSAQGDVREVLEVDVMCELNTKTGVGFASAGGMPSGGNYLYLQIPFSNQDALIDLSEPTITLDCILCQQGDGLVSDSFGNALEGIELRFNHRDAQGRIYYTGHTNGSRVRAMLTIDADGLGGRIDLSLSRIMLNPPECRAGMPDRQRLQTQLTLWDRSPDGLSNLLFSDDWACGGAPNFGQYKNVSRLRTPVSLP
ncbi:MAG: hypothetical protein AAGF35_04340, partial [Pseudomonadota bacterium]